MSSSFNLNESTSSSAWLFGDDDLQQQPDETSNDEILMEFDTGLEPDFHSMLATIISVVYGVISIGFFSNVIVAVVVGNILLRLGSTLPNRHMLVYVFALCIVDALVLGTLPMLIIQIYLQTWIFGQTLCTMYWIIDSINKTLSTFILLCLSFDRYLAVRFPHRCIRIRTVRGALYILFSCVVFAAVLLMPVYLHAEITYVDIDEPSNASIGGAGFQNGTNKVPTCAFVGQTSFIFTIFILCYFVPFACMSFFYGSMLLRLRHRSKKLGVRQGRVRRVTTKTLTLVISYFVCWTPYWAVTLHHVVAEALRDYYEPDEQTDISHEIFTTSNTTSHQIDISASPSANHNFLWTAIRFGLLYATHSGCYLNSAINPILYALLNRELRRQHHAAMGTTSKAGGGSQVFLNSAVMNGNAAHKSTNYGLPPSPQLQRQTQPLLVVPPDSPRSCVSRSSDRCVSPNLLTPMRKSPSDESPKALSTANRCKESKKSTIRRLWMFVRGRREVETVGDNGGEGGGNRVTKKAEFTEKDFIKISERGMREASSYALSDDDEEGSAPVLL